MLSRTQVRLNPLTFALGLMLLGGVLAAFIITPDLFKNWSWREVIVVESILIVIMSLGPCAIRLLKKQELDLFEPLVGFALLYIVTFAVRPLFLISPWITYVYDLPYEVYANLPITDEDIAQTLLYALIGIACFHIGYRSLHNPLEGNTIVSRERTWNSRRVSVVAILSLLLAGLSLTVIIPVISDTPTLLLNFGRLRSFLMGYGYIGLGLDWLNLAVLVLWVDHLQGHRRPIILPVLIFSNLYNLAMGGRAGVFNLWFSMFLAYHYLSQKKKLVVRRWILGIVIAVVAISFTISAGEIRNKQVSNLDDITELISSLWSERTIGTLTATVMLEFNQVDIFATLLHVGPDTFPFLWGSSYLGLFQQMVPRFIWPDKPWPYDVDIGFFVSGVRSAIPPSMVGEFYLNFHIPGIIVGMYLFGLLCRRVYQRLLAKPRNPGAVLIYCLLLPYLPILLSRSFVAGWSTIILFVVPAWFAMKYITTPKKTAKSSLPVRLYSRPAPALGEGQHK